MIEKPDIEKATPPRPSMWSKLRTYFFTGLVITAPAVITIWATLWVISSFDGWVKPLIPFVYNPDNYLPFKIPGYGLVFALAFITVVGALGANLVGRTLLGWWDKLLNRTPIVRSIYKGSKQIFETIFSEKGSSFKQVCLVEWPRKGTWSLAFISRDVDGGSIGLEKGRAMPDHGHGGEELTLVLKGSYSDKFGKFSRGDLADLAEDVEHQPIVDSDETCICLISFDVPAKFKSIWARLAQPFSGM